MNILITGGSGMIGSLVIEAALAAPMVNKIISVGRRPTPHVANKLEQIDKSDFTKWNDVDLSEIDAVIFCLPWRLYRKRI